MQRIFCLLVAIFLIAAASPLHQEKKSFPPDAATRAQIEEETRALGEAIDKERGTVLDRFLPNVEIYHKAAKWAVVLDEWPQKESVAWTLEALEAGRQRLKTFHTGKGDWAKTQGKVVMGYQSTLDDSVQPYAVTYPRDFKPDRQYRLDVVLHGRDATLNEVKFLHQHRKGEAPADRDFIQLEVFGRGNNAYRWAGEQDVIEAMRHFVHTSKLQHRGYIVDPERIVLRGFSMGGAGAWHLGLHYPHVWRAVSPGAGFTATKGYVKNLPDPLPPHQEACLRIYDAVAVAENVFCTPFIAYGGEKDPQLQAARNIETLVKPLGTPFPGAFPLQVIIGPDTAHKYHPQSLREIMKQLQDDAELTRPYPQHLRFVPTAHYGTCHWVNVVALTDTYANALVEAEYKKPNRFEVKTKNVDVLQLFLLPGNTAIREVAVEIDGQPLNIPPFPAPYISRLAFQGTRSVMVERKEGRWYPTFPHKFRMGLQREPRKYLELSGPIDMAFQDSFVCVLGTGKPWNVSAQRHAEAEFSRFRAEWQKYFRGELPVKFDVDVTSKDLEHRHLILFGDPGSNQFIAQALEKLPLEWTRERLQFGGQSFSSADHLPKLIYPSPFQTGKYIVVNSGHTFHAADFEGTNALLYPRLGDYAIVKVKPTDKGEPQEEVVRVGLFDEHWRVK